jgi:limonene-1,2-epoxide hydrolase
MNTSSMISEHGSGRRSFLLSAALGSAGTLLAASRVDAAEWGQTEKANVKIVNDFCAAISTRDAKRVTSFFADDLVYRPTETTAPIHGRDALAATFKKWTETSDRMEFRVLETFAAGPIVMNHRIDESSGPARRLKWDGIGVFFVKDGKIKEWSDYTISLEK